MQKTNTTLATVQFNVFNEFDVLHNGKILLSTISLPHAACECAITNTGILVDVINMFVADYGTRLSFYFRGAPLLTARTVIGSLTQFTYTVNRHRTSTSYADTAALHLLTILQQFPCLAHFSRPKYTHSYNNLLQLMQQYYKQYCTTIPKERHNGWNEFLSR